MSARPADTLPAAAGVALVLLFLLVFDWGGEGFDPTIGNVTLLSLSVYATMCMALAARFAQGRARRAWGTMVLACAFWAIGDAVRTFYDLSLPHAPFPNPSAFCYLASSFLTVVGIVFFLNAKRLQSRLRLLLDGATVALSLTLILWTTALHEVYDSSPRPSIGIVVMVLFPVLHLMALTIAVPALVNADARDRGALWWMSGAIGLTAFAHNASASSVFTGVHEPTAGYTHLLWAGALIALAAAALASRRTSPPSRPAMKIPSNSSLWLPYMPLLLSGIVGPALILSGLERVLVPLVMVTVCLRQMLAAWENRRLLIAVADRSLRDPLTGLANRTLFSDRLAHAITLPRSDDHSVAVVSVDLDDFKLVNDGMGHQAADTILVHVGQRISACIRPNDTAARYGGDEFILLLEGRVDDSQLIAERVVEAFREPFLVDGESMLLHPSVGIAFASPVEPDLTADALVKRADIAMYAAKRAQTKGVHTFSLDMALVAPELVETTRRVGGGRSAGDGAAQVRLLGELRDATRNHGLEVVYQPKVDLQTNQVVGVESLLRWPHPQLGTLRPAAFMSLVRQHGLMRPVTELVLNLVLDDAAYWVSQGVHAPVAVNVFAPVLRDEHLPDALIGALRKRGLTPNVLTIEITEDLVFSEGGRAADVLHRLREHGIRVSIDDFGSGYSALSYLRDLPIDEVKLDRSFIESVTTDARAASVVRSVIGLAHELDLTVVAEGIQDADTASWLREHGCDIGQGYYFGRPAAAGVILQRLQR
ncbi:GGDEF-domain containing protein [Mycobacterium sp. AT1]|nr:GGDEF-domain containing protein [Mycobacterium sp. AT1]